MSRVTVRLPDLRARRRLSQRQLAALAGVRPDTVSSLERGASAGIRFDTLASLCEALGCTPGDLLDLDGDAHQVPVFGRDDEDSIIATRLADPGRRVDGPSFLAELIGTPR